MKIKGGKMESDRVEKQMRRRNGEKFTVHTGMNVVP